MLSSRLVTRLDLGQKRTKRNEANETLCEICHDLPERSVQYRLEWV
ncbi:unnamed protein product, partial [Heterotrigona itama]